MSEKIDVVAAQNHQIGPEHYRYSENHEEDGVMIYLHRFVVVRETPECWWVCKASWVHMLRWTDLAQARKQKVVKRVLKNARAKHCWPTLEEAWHSYSIRKRYEVRKLQHRLDVVKQAMSAMPEAPPQETLDRHPAVGFARVFNCGTPACHDEYSWE